MNKICEFIINNYEYNYNISYYIKQSQQDLISYDPTDNFDIVNYICDSIHDYFNTYKYDIFIDYKEPAITVIYKNHKCIITIKTWYDNTLYWILSMSII